MNSSHMNQINKHTRKIREKKNFLGFIPRAEMFNTDDGSVTVQRHWEMNGGKWMGCTLLSLFSPPPLHIITTDPDNTAAHDYTINASAAISTMFYLSLSYQKWLVQQWLAVGGVNGSSWHSGRSWHPETAANQASIQTPFRLSQNKYTVCVPDRLQLQLEKLIWSKLAALWSNLTGCVRHKYKAEVTGVCGASVVSSHLKFTTLSQLFFLPFRIKWRSFGVCIRVSITGV